MLRTLGWPRFQRSMELRGCTRGAPSGRRSSARPAASTPTESATPSDVPRAQQVAGGAGHVPRAAEDGVEEQHLAEPELGRRYQRRRLQGLEPARSDDALERTVQLALGRLHRCGDRAGEAQPYTKAEQRLGKPKRPHDGSPSTLSFGPVAELSPDFAPGSWFASRRDHSPPAVMPGPRSGHLLEPAPSKFGQTCGWPERVRP